MSAPDMLPDELTERFLRSLKKQFYANAEKQFFQEKRILMMAITYPAQYLNQRGVGLPSARYQEILTTIIRTINAHGNLAKINSPGRYLLHAVQEHMRHHGEDYYEAGKKTRNDIADVLLGLKKAKAGAIQSDSTVSTLAEAHRVLSAARGGRKKSASTATATPLQPDFFAPAKPTKKACKPAARDSGSVR